MILWQIYKLKHVLTFCSVSGVQGFYCPTHLIIWFWMWFCCCSSSVWRLSGSFTVRTQTEILGRTENSSRLTDQLLNCTSQYSWGTIVIVQRMQQLLSVNMAAAVMWHRKKTCGDIIDDSWWCVVVQVGRGTCVSVLWPPASRFSSWSPVWRWLFTTCCCRPLFCGWSSSSAPSCSASTASSSCLDFSPCPHSPGDLIIWCVWAGLSLLKIFIYCNTCGRSFFVCPFLCFPGRSKVYWNILTSPETEQQGRSTQDGKCTDATL